MTLNHPKAAPDSAIISFWDWFRSIVSKLEDDLENAAVLAELSSRVVQLGKVSWEVGPGLHEEYALVITPDGSMEWLSTCQHIIELAPSLPRWEFHATKPPKNWELEFSLESTSGNMIDINAKKWRYVLFRFPDSTFDIVVEQVGLENIEDDDRYTAAVIVLDGVVGELKRMELIQGIETVINLSETLSEEESKKASPIKVLAEHLESLQETS